MTQRIESVTAEPLADRLVSRADAHDKTCMGAAMGLGYFSGNDARLMRDAADALRTPSQPAASHQSGAAKPPFTPPPIAAKPGMLQGMLIRLPHTNAEAY